jgi:hypothetical protein
MTLKTSHMNFKKLLLICRTIYAAAVVTVEAVAVVVVVE